VLEIPIQKVRAATERLCAPLTVEDQVVQSMPDASPVKWHLAHTSWFFETFALKPGIPGYREYHPLYNYLFNSYYDALGERHERARRGLLARPTVAEVREYRAHVDRHLAVLLDRGGERLAPVLWLGLHHEQQHQELLLTDVKHLFAQNPLRPAYATTATGATAPRPRARPAAPLEWLDFDETLASIGAPDGGFAFDCERPRHRVLLQPYRLASRAVTAGEYLDFMRDGGYRRPELWLADGWAAARAGDWQAPLYWEPDGGDFTVMTLAGPRPVERDAPVCHVSYYEADAYARWAGARLPTEFEWERAASGAAGAIDGNFVESGALHPLGGASLYGDVWQWTSSAYQPYPGYRAPDGALGEYNGKFMCNQQVLRGGSCLTPRAHVRSSYRNYFAPGARWQMSGVRLAKDRR